MAEPLPHSDMLIPAWDEGRLAPRDKLEVHRLGLRHPAVSVFVTAGDSLLIQRRALAKYHTPGLWANSCCTHPHWGEAPQACAERRLGQELGLTGLNLNHRGQIEYRAEVGNGMFEHELVEVFLARVPARPPLAPDPDEVMATRWIDFRALFAEILREPQRFTPWLRIYLSDHAQMIFGPD